MTTSEYDESLQVAEFCLMHRSIMVSCTKPPLNGKNRPDLVVHDRWRECRLSDRNPVVQLRRSVRLLIAINESQRMRERPGNHHEKAFKKDFLGDCRQTSKTRQRLLGLSGGGLWIPPTAPGLSNGIAQLCGTVRGGSSRSG